MFRCTIDRYSTASGQYVDQQTGGSGAAYVPAPHRQGGIYMDKIIRFTLGLLLVILIAFISVFSYQLYVEHAYQSSLTGTYTYSCTITTDSPLSNVTLFIPVPADTGGNSPVVAAFSAGTVAGIPAGWNVTPL